MVAGTQIRDPGEGLLERSAELLQIARALDAAQGGDGSQLVLEGPAGIGKTRLLEAAREAARERGFRVLIARGGELERDYAYGVVRQLLERAVVAAAPQERAALLAGPAAHAGAAVGIEPALGHPAAEDHSFAVRHGLYWLVSNLAAEGPLLLAIDDAHWADAASLRFLAYLARRLEGIPVLVAMTLRTGDPSTDQAVLESVAVVADTRVTPSPLSVAATADVLAERTQTPVDVAFAAACHAATGGNPFLLGELASALAEDEVAPVAANAGRVAELGPRTVARSLVLRLGRVSHETVQFARAVAVLGVSADPRHAAALSGMAEEAARASFDALAVAGVLAPERPLRFAHPILREAVYRDLPPAERDRLHTAAARLLLDSGAPASEIAAHLLATPPAGQPATVAALREAARVALGQGASDLAARYLRRALDEPPGPDERAPVLADLGRAEWLSGDDPAAAVAHLRAALAATADRQTRTELAIALARAAFATGDVAGAAATLDAELEAPEVTRDEALLMEAELGSIRMLNNRDPEFEHFGRRVERFGDLPGDTIPELLVLTNVAVWHWLHGTANDAARIAELSLGDGRAVEAAGGDSIAVLQVAYVLVHAERHDLAQRAAASALAAARSTGSIFGLAGWHALRAVEAYRRGDVVHMEAEARNGIAVPGLPPFFRPSLHAFLALALVERGELAEAEEVLLHSGVGPKLPLLPHMTPAFYARGQLRVAQGRLEEACADLLEHGARDEKLYIENPAWPWRAAAARVLAALGQPDEARRHAEEHLAHARRWGTAGALGGALHACAVTAVPVDVEALGEAVAVLERSPARLDRARALADLGAAQRAAGRRSDAQETLKQAIELARACGATALVRRAHQELLAAGARPRRLQFSGLEALTASERRICELAADGRSNREIAQELFITPKTVENHLGRAYMKLGVSSRDALGEVLKDSVPG